MKDQRGFRSVSLILILVLGLAVLAGGVYFFVEQDKTDEVQGQNNSFELDKESDVSGQAQNNGLPESEQIVSSSEKLQQKISFTSATLTANPTNGTAPLTVNFTGQIAVPYNQGGSAVMFFGDDVSDVMFRSGPELFNENWTHTYEEPGVYEATLVLSSVQNVDSDIQVMQNPNYAKNTIVKQVTINVIQEDEQDYSVDTKTYRDDTLGLSFDFPAAWGDVTVNNSRGTCVQGYSVDDCNFRTLLFKDIYSAAVFLSAETGGHHNNPLPRGSFWGDSAGDINSDYLTVCEQDQMCSIYRNDSGIYFARYEADPPPAEMGYQPERYYVYNPNNQYYGLVLSSYRLDSSSPENTRLFKEVVIESFKFLE